MTPTSAAAPHDRSPPPPEERIRDLVRRMTLAEKVGQLQLVNGAGGRVPEWLRDAVAAGRVGAVLNEVDVGTVNALQRIAIEESRLGIPLLVGRDVIHGFATVFPIPLGQAATWDPDLVERCARLAALEAAAAGVNWTFAPMMDIGRDPRWGRIAETFGEDPYLGGVLAAAMVRGFQGEALDAPGSIAACAKHFAGYGASESGRDYNTTSIPEGELRDVHLPPFKAALDAGVATFMTSFSDLNGIPATASELLLRRILREEWGFDGFVVSDWDSVRQLAVHGLTEDDRASAREAATAGLDMEMAGGAYADHLAALVEDATIPVGLVDAMVTNVLRVKQRLGLFERAYTDPSALPGTATPAHLEAAHQAALESVVLLRNEGGALPLARESLRTLAVIGPLADDPAEQLGTWVFDGDPRLSRTPLQAIRDAVGPGVEVRHARALDTTRSRDRGGFAEAVAAAHGADAALLFLGEEAILSGEAHCRADITLPGIQEDLVREIAATGTPVILVLMTGRPLALERVVPHVRALLCAWHPGTMAGPAIADLLFGAASPCGRLPVTFPRVTGQVPIYYAHRNTGKPATADSIVHIDDIPRGAPQTSVGATSFHLDAGASPLYTFGFGLTYSRVEYRDIRTDRAALPPDGTITISAEVTNLGGREVTEVAQLYVRDLVGSRTRPVRELRGFQRLHLAPGEQRTVTFRLRAADLAFHGRQMQRVVEPGRFHAWIGASADARLKTEFEIVER